MEEEKYFAQKMAGNDMLSHIAVEAQIRTLPKYYPEEGYHVFHNVNVKGETHYFIYEWRYLHQLGSHILKKLEKEPEFLDHMVKVWKENTQELKDYEKRLDGVVFKDCSNEELKAMFKRIIHLLQEEYSYPLLCDAFGLHTEPVLIEKLRNIVPGEKKIASYLSTLIAPVFESFTSREAKSLLRIVAEIDKLPGAKERIEKGDFSSIDPGVDDLLEEHCKNFFWISNGYHQGVKVGKEYFLKQIQEFYKENMSAGRTLEDLERKMMKNREEKEKLMDELGFNDELRNLIRWIEVFTYMHDERKGLMIEAFFYIEEILREISRRTGLGLDKLNACFHFEIPDVLSGKFDIDEIYKRMELCYFAVHDQGFRYCTGKEATKWKDKLLLSHEGVKEIEEIRGNPASPGVAIGRVRIIPTVKDINSIERGEILVTGMTRPDYIIAMKKAAAIVTDEGGITCHAAIVSRELGIPCVIGTKMATQVLRDGMLVEVSGNHGRVRVLK